MPNRRLHVVLSDLHIPFEDADAVRLAVDFCRREQPGTIHLLGDILDCYLLSRFVKNAGRATTLQDEFDAGTRFLADLRRKCPKARIIFSEGNHCARLEKYLNSSARELANLRALTIPELLSFDKLKIEWVPESSPYRVGHILLTHGQVVSKHSGQTARAHVDKFGCCVLHGHSHRLGTYYKTTYSDTVMGAENGCLCSLTPEYTLSPDWTHGFSIIDEVGGMFHLEQVAIVNSQYVYRGKRHR